MLAGRWLGSIGPKEAARELLCNTDLKQQRQALQQMKPHRAAALLEVCNHVTGLNPCLYAVCHHLCTPAN